jgi:hypothetical protein
MRHQEFCFEICRFGMMDILSRATSTTFTKLTSMLENTRHSCLCEIPSSRGYTSNPGETVNTAQEFIQLPAKPETVTGCTIEEVQA